MVKKKILSAMAAAFVAVQLLGTTVITAQASTITGAVSTCGSTSHYNLFLQRRWDFFEFFSHYAPHSRRILFFFSSLSNAETTSSRAAACSICVSRILSKMVSCV